MNILQSLNRSPLPIHLYRCRVTILNKSVNKPASNCPVAAYSICCTQRRPQQTTLKPPPNTFQFQSHRNRSYAEAFQQIYIDISHSTTVSYFQSAHIAFHDVTGLPWWATIIVYTIGLRLTTFPLALYGQVMRGKIENIFRNEMPKMEKELQAIVATKSKHRNLNAAQASMMYRREFKKRYQEMIERDNCHPLKTTILHWFQIPIWVCHSIGIRNILTGQPNPTSPQAIKIVAQLGVGGCLWLPNLIEADTTYILPAIWCITNLINIELGALERTGPPSRFSTIFTNVFRGITIAVAPIAATVPSCLTLYWCTSALCALAQNLILLSPRVKRLAGVPTNTIHYMEQPYRTLAKRFVEQMQRRKDWCTALFKSKEKTSLN